MKIVIIIILIILILTNLLGYSINDAFTTTQLENTDRCLDLILTSDPTSYSSSVFRSTSLGGNFNYGLFYLSVKDVQISIDGEFVRLEDALCNGQITENQIFYLARSDAEKGICTELSKSIYGLTTYFFDYEDYSIELVYDLLEAPDGSQHQISHMTIRPTHSSHDTAMFLYDMYQNPVIVEDWGLAFKVESAVPNSIRMKTAQVNGQQLGELYVISYALANEHGILELVTDDINVNTLPEAIPIKMGEPGELIIDWENYYGTLDAGDYMIVLTVQDQFDREQVHPLMVDYYDIYSYQISFKVE